MSYKHILVAVDLSKSSEIVISKAVALARDSHSKLSFIHVDANYISNIGYATVYGQVKPISEQREANQREKEELQKELNELVGKFNYPVASSIVVMGRLKDELNSVVKKMNVDLLVCGHHHDFWSNILSSVPKLVSSATTDLLVVCLE